MPLKRSQLREHVQTVEVDVFGEKLNVSYRPGIMTRAFLRKFLTIGSGIEIAGLSEEEAEAKFETVKKEVSADLQSLIVSWDYLDDDDKPYPITVETFDEHVPQVLLDRIMAAIRQDQEVPKA
jgi:hypothetical protein